MTSLAGNFGDKSMSLMPELLELYPNDPSVGSPFDASLVGAAPDDSFYGGEGNEYKRAAAVLSDGLFTAGRRMQLDASVALKKIKCYSYLFAQPTPLIALLTPAVSLRRVALPMLLSTDSTALRPMQLGVDHASESPFVYAAPPKALSATSAYASDADLQKTSDIMSGEADQLCQPLTFVC